ncbi:hypothetical protein MPTK1_2g07560 [Marchantia polymorpha subsp. ruderalis]|nr:hypothetical protein MARPO_0015s0042 [Marchantia polymorpha]BBN01460.1 hypothetical protein Mp_2g07560 [Marchantia polymorpha subsp. ruderalis]|eukprot:PTQ45227.1 hypothetical protein MARPO_0015s0042 [Marchantia polymorpha]
MAEDTTMPGLGPNVGILKTVVVSKVAPSSTTEHAEVIYPSVYDLFVFDTYIPIVSLYRLDNTLLSAFSAFIHNVKDSLSKLQSLYYPLAGKWVVAEDLYIRKLLCNDEGAVFVEATVDDEMDKYFDFVHDFNPPNELFGEFAIPGFCAEDAHKMPLNKEWPNLIIQVTGFKCGGVALVVTYNHMLMDGFAFDRCLKAWSEIAATGHTSMKPNFDRSSLPTLFDKAQMFGLSPDMKNVDDVLANAFRTHTTARSFRSSPYRSVSKCYQIHPDAVERLRRKAKEGQASESLELPERFTNFECISTQMWRCFSRLPVVHEHMTGSEKVYFSFPAEARKRTCKPPLTEDFVGNMVLIVSPPVLTGAELREKSFAFAACKVHESILDLNADSAEDRWTDTTHARLQKKQSENPEGCPTALQSGLTSWIRFTNFYALDFGFGIPLRVTPCFFYTIPEFTMGYLMTPRPQSGVVADMFLRLSPRMSELILKDPEFLDLVS